ncbi:hypothetical protein [Pontibacter lucknowensis]|uniref:Uncharacterized protein n=1 Tax=Pontibacter lucknowensis TaxID=1077936 RepID=A0A1N7AYN7_9BACT|nr:hypothetical protein [Pontibacter lucknowensis]SIR44073.1 hypothetical protein SAMN05421545_3671 [Pontibacter lucknowensis]
MVKKYIRSALNKIRYGANAPAFAELIFVDPMQVNHYSFAWKQKDSGRVIGGDWDREENMTEISSRFKYNACIERWKLNKSWEDTGIYEFMLDFILQRNKPVDKCSTLDEILTRYKRLDQLFEHVKSTGKLKTQRELNPRSYNEEGGIFIHIGRQNQVIFGGGGIHRLAIAKVLQLSSIPAQLGVIHPEALSTWKVYKQIPASHLTLTK